MSAIMSYLFKQSLPSPDKKNFIAAVAGRCINVLFKVILRFTDPVVRVALGGRFISINLSHNLPRIMAGNPYYDTALPRLCVYLRRVLGHLTFVDVGANVGDTVSLISNKVEGDFLCVEADPGYFSLLLENTRDLPQVVCENVFLGEATGTIDDLLVKTGGTAHVSSEGSSGNLVTSRRMTTVDDLVSEHASFFGSNVIKIDTDGYDYKIIRGAQNLIAKAKPVIFFELTPEYLVAQGEDPASIFSFLKDLGYGEVVFYDNHGYPLLKTSILDSGLISQLLDYASFKQNFYFDVLSFPATLQKEFDEFYASEVLYFKNSSAAG